MAKIIENEKGFKVIEMSRAEICDTGGYGICDDCNASADKGYYIAVLNSWLCEKCYQRWIKRAVNYEEDRWVELMNFERYKKLLKL